MGVAILAGLRRADEGLLAISLEIDSKLEAPTVAPVPAETAKSCALPDGVAAELGLMIEASAAAAASMIAAGVLMSVCSTEVLPEGGVSKVVVDGSSRNLRG